MWDGDCGSSEEGTRPTLGGYLGKDEEVDENEEKEMPGQGNMGKGTEVRNSLMCGRTCPLSSVA